jgi:hypothetical protein
LKGHEPDRPIDSVCRAFLFVWGENMAAHAFIIVNGKAFPAPGRFLNFIVAATVKAGRNVKQRSDRAESRERSVQARQSILAASDRRHMVHIPYAWSSADE